MLVNVDLPNFVRQYSLHGGLNGRAPDAGPGCGITDIIFIWHSIITRNNHQVGPPRWPTSEKPDTFISEWVWSSQVLPRQ